MSFTIDFNNYKTIELDVTISPCDMCVLSENRLLLTNYKERSLALYDQDFNLIKKFNNLESSSSSSTTTTTVQDGHDQHIGSVCVDRNPLNDNIYISDYNNHKIYITDNDFNKLVVSDGNSNKLKHPFGVCYHDNYIYICDCGNKRIQKLNANDLGFDSLFNLDFKPWRIKIANNLACVRATITNPSINFYDLSTFNLLIRYSQHNGIIGVIDNKFYEYHGPSKKIYCYSSINGELENEYETDGLGLADNAIYSRNGSIITFNEFIIIGSHDTQKLCLIKK